MAAFTGKELFLLLLMVSVCSGILGWIFRKGLKVILCIGLAICVYAVFFNWLPAQLDAGNTPEQIVDSTVKDFGNSGIAESIGQTAGETMNYVNDNKEDWGEALSNLFRKITFSYEEARNQ